MKKLLILLTCILGIGTVAPTPAQAGDGCRPRVKVYRGSCAYPVYRSRYYNYNAYPYRSVRNYNSGYYYRDDCDYYRPRAYTYRPRVGFSLFFAP